MVTWPEFSTNWKPSADAGGARSLPGVHEVPCPHPWLGITTPLSPPPDDAVPELLPALASSPAGPPLLELAVAVPPEDDPVPLEEGPLDDPAVPDDDPPPELVLVAGLPLPS